MPDRVVSIRTPGGHVAHLVVDPSDHIGSRIVRRHQFYERPMLDDLRSRVGRGGLAVDIGAHIGNHTVWMAAACGLDVVAVEPNPASRARLEEAVARNQLADRVTVVPVAAGAAPSTGSLVHRSETNSGMTAVRDDASGDVPIVPIDSLELSDVRVMKVDVEGSAVDVIRGAAETIARDTPVLYVEHPDPGEVLDLLDRVTFGTPGTYDLRRPHFCATPTWLFTPWRQVSLSATIMAHPSRADQVDELRAGLDDVVTVTWDRRGDRWDTGRRALLNHAPSATHHLVLQDDVVPAEHLLAAVRAIAAVLPPGAPASLYCGRGRTTPRPYRLHPLFAAARHAGAPFMRFSGPWWGQAVLNPTAAIPDLVAWGDGHPEVVQYDHRQTGFWDEVGLDCWYTAPSLVQHLVGDDHPSLLDHGHGRGRTSPWVADDALLVDWQARAVTPEDLPPNLSMSFPPPALRPGH